MPESAHTDRCPSWSERCIYAAYLGSGLLALALALLACGSGRFILLLLAALALVASLFFRARLILDGQLTACAEENDTPEARHQPGLPEAPGAHGGHHAGLEYHRDMAHAEP